jgi:hypothetical protein
MLSRSTEFFGFFEDFAFGCFGFVFKRMCKFGLLRAGEIGYSWSMKSVTSHSFYAFFGFFVWFKQGAERVCA